MKERISVLFICLSLLFQSILGAYQSNLGEEELWDATLSNRLYLLDHALKDSYEESFGEPCGTIIVTPTRSWEVTENCEVGTSGGENGSVGNSGASTGDERESSETSHEPNGPIFTEPNGPLVINHPSAGEVLDELIRNEERADYQRNQEIKRQVALASGAFLSQFSTEMSNSRMHNYNNIVRYVKKAESFIRPYYSDYTVNYAEERELLIQQEVLKLERGLFKQSLTLLGQQNSNLKNQRSGLAISSALGGLSDRIQTMPIVSLSSESDSEEEVLSISSRVNTLLMAQADQETLKALIKANLLEVELPPIAYQFKAEESEFKVRNVELYKNLYYVKAENPQAVQAKTLGLEFTVLADNEFSKGREDSAEYAHEVALSLLDIALGVIPVISVGKDAYEFFLGKNLLTGETLSKPNRMLAGIGLLTLGTSNIMKGAAKFIPLLGDYAKAIFKNSKYIVPKIKKALALAGDFIQAAKNIYRVTRDFLKYFSPKAIIQAITKIDDLKRVRDGYRLGIAEIGEVISTKLAKGIPKEDIARYAHAKRRSLGEKFKDLTPSEIRKGIYKRNLMSYDNKLGPTWEYLILKANDRGLEGDHIFEHIIKTSQRPNKDINMFVDMLYPITQRIKGIF